VPKRVNRELHFAIANDGKTIIYSAAWDAHVRKTDWLAKPGTRAQKITAELFRPGNGLLAYYSIM
jgi:hypothetical protein